jgi:hypothetical protein
MFRTVFPSNIRSLRLYMQHQVYVVSPKRNRTFEIARQWAGAGPLRWWCCVAGTLSFIFTLATSRHFSSSSSYAGLSERVFSALGDFLQVEKWRTMTMHLLTRRFLSVNFWRRKRRLSCPSPPTLQIWHLRIFPVPKVEVHHKRSPISDGRGDKRKFATGPSRHPAKHVPGRVPELEETLGAVYQQ